MPLSITFVIGTSRMPRGKKNPVRVTFQKVDPAARKHRETARHHSTKVGAPAVLHERSLESLWYDITPEGLTFLDWHRAWNGGYPDEHASTSGPSFKLV